MFNFLKDLTSELAAYPLEQKLEIESFCFHIGKLHTELVRMPEENAAALLNHFSSLRELLDFYSAAQELRPVLPAEEPVAVQPAPVQDAIHLRTVYIWQQPDDSENLANLPDAHNWRGALVFDLENEQEKEALESLLIKRIASRRVPAFCFALDYTDPGHEKLQTSGEVWRCLPNTVEFSTARTPANYKLMGAAPALRACQVFHAQFVAPMDNIQMFEL
jgi:hypothetical protein